MKNTSLLKILSCLVVTMLCLTTYCMAEEAPISNKAYAFIGDSRFVGMKNAIEKQPNITWIAKDGAGSMWYWQNRKKLEDLNKNTIIVYELGINDLFAEECVEILNDLTDIGFKHVYFTTIPPVEEEKCVDFGYSVKNQDIRKFNAYVMKNLPYGVTVLDSYTSLSDSSKGYETDDGVHCTIETYQTWFVDIMDNIDSDIRNRDC